MKKLLPLFIIIITIMSCCEKNTDLELNVLDKLSAQESWKVESSLNYFKFNEEGEYVQASGRSISETEVCYTLIDISTVQNIEIVESNTEVLRIRVSSMNSDDHYYNLLEQHKFHIWASINNLLDANNVPHLMSDYMPATASHVKEFEEKLQGVSINNGLYERPKSVF